jgi:DNA polymerase III sliding clamp (beta) subunit (PCNA family)
MKATVSAGELAAAAALATAALDSKVSIPALHAARLSAADGTLRLGVSNLDQAIDVTVPAEIEAPGECAPNAGAIGKLAAGFPASAMIALAADARGFRCSVGDRATSCPSCRSAVSRTHLTRRTQPPSR